MNNNPIFNTYVGMQKYKSEGHGIIIIAGAEYGSGSSRDSAAKGPMLLGVKSVIAKSFERIHRSNLVGMGIIPLCFKPAEDADSLGLTGRERYTIHLPSKISDISPGQDLMVTTHNGRSFTCTLRLDTQVCSAGSSNLRKQFDQNRIFSGDLQAIGGPCPPAPWLRHYIQFLCK